MILENESPVSVEDVSLCNIVQFSLSSDGSLAGGGLGGGNHFGAPGTPFKRRFKGPEPLNLLNMFTLHFTLENEHGTQKMDVWKMIFSFFQSGDF